MPAIEKGVPMKNPKLAAADVARWMQNLTDQEFVTFFYSQLSERHIYRAERRYIDSHLVLANSKRTCEEGQYVGPWQLEFICASPQDRSLSDASLSQVGECCGQQMVSVGKTSVCPICSALVYGS
jgi:hypothetical protein